MPGTVLIRNECLRTGIHPLVLISFEAQVVTEAIRFSITEIRFVYRAIGLVSLPFDGS